MFFNKDRIRPLFESDADLRGMERRAASGDLEARDRLDLVRRRAGMPNMDQHMDNYVKAAKSYDDFPHPRNAYEEQIAEEERQKFLAARKEVHRQAAQTGRGAAHFLTKSHSEGMGRRGGGVNDWRDHIHDMVGLHGGWPKASDNYTSTAAFDNKEDASHVHSAIKLRYPGAEPKVRENNGKHIISWLHGYSKPIDPTGKGGK